MIMRIQLKKTIKELFSRFNCEIVSYPKPSLGDYSCDIDVGKIQFVDLDKVSSAASTIQGMTSLRSGEILYSLCYFQHLDGDVVEIGSWQGRSTSYLARACKESGNGRFFAIDHFLGNVGKENSYQIRGASDISIQQRFSDNMVRVGLSKDLTVIDTSSQTCTDRFENNSIRFLFIDGDHTYEGVQSDLRSFVPKLKSKSIIVFDDFKPGFSGLITAVDEYLQATRIDKIMSYKGTLVVTLH